jgi:hypothetical protein
MSKWCCIWLILGLSLGEMSMAKEQQIVLREHLNKQWTNELLTYPFSAEKGACHERSITLMGPQGPMPA